MANSSCLLCVFASLRPLRYCLLLLPDFLPDPSHALHRLAFLFDEFDVMGNVSDGTL